jgi:hypothetical protein
MESALSANASDVHRLAQMVNGLRAELRGQPSASDETPGGGLGGLGGSGSGSLGLQGGVTLGLQSQGVLKRDEARMLIAWHVENTLGATLGAAALTQRPPPADDLSLGSSAASLPPLHARAHSASQGSSSSSSSVGGSGGVREERRLFLTAALKGNGGLAQATPQPQGQRWRPTHRKRAHEHMRPIFAGALGGTPGPGGASGPGANFRSTDPPSSTIAVPEQFVYPSGRGGALRSFGPASKY